MLSVVFDFDLIVQRSMFEQAQFLELVETWTCYLVTDWPDLWASKEGRAHHLDAAPVSLTFTRSNTRQTDSLGRKILLEQRVVRVHGVVITCLLNETFIAVILGRGARTLSSGQVFMTGQLIVLGFACSFPVLLPLKLIFSHGPSRTFVKRLASQTDIGWSTIKKVLFISDSIGGLYDLTHRLGLFG